MLRRPTKWQDYLALHRAVYSGLVSILFINVLCLAVEQVLPPVEEVLPHQDTLATQVSVFVREFRFEGNSAFTDEELREVVKNYSGRKLTSEELHEVRRVLTLHYVENGYINSGAILPDQKVKDGVITLLIVEGELSRIKISGNKQTRTEYIKQRVTLGVDKPLDLARLKTNLDILRQNLLFKRVQAQLQPGEEPGRSRLELIVEEKEPFHAAFAFDNFQNPSSGAERFSLLVGHQNLTGRGDSLSLDYDLTTNGLEDIEFACFDKINARYTLPIAASDTMLTLGYYRSDILLIEEPFVDLDITSESETYSLGVRHPFYRTPSTEFSLSLTAERRSSQSELLGRSFSFSPGDENGKSDVTVLRFGQEWTTRTREKVIAARSLFTFGLPILGATDHDGDLPDSEFLAWLGQIQYVQRLGSTPNRIIMRLNTQLANDNLLPLEQLGMGGIYTVRGYREHQIIRDNATIGNLELRIPLLRDAATDSDVLQLAPFFDIGYGWDAHHPKQDEMICSSGLGLLFNIHDKVDARLYWGVPFRNFDSAEYNLQDSGIHFSLICRLF
jgi:hemolysin activation/secretion protein